MKFEHIEVFNFEGAFRGLRNPKNSWHLSDSCFGLASEWVDSEWINEIAADWAYVKFGDNVNSEEAENYTEEIKTWLSNNCYLRYDPDVGSDLALIGPKDMDLAQRLIKAGPEHRKFLRQIFVSVDITAPLFWFKEFDTYKIGITANSTSTMHKLATTPITMENFELGDYDENIALLEDGMSPEAIVFYCETLRKKYLATKDKRYWKELIRWLPEGWLQTRTVTMNYENLHSMYLQRKNHKLTEWSVDFMNFIKKLPYAEELICFY